MKINTKTVLTFLEASQIKRVVIVEKLMATMTRGSGFEK